MMVVKIGGSLITNKSKYRTFRRASAEKIISAIAKEDLSIVVHGGGSFGHIAAEKYNLKNNPLTPENRLGGSVVKNDMSDLNHRIVSILINHNVNAVGISPFTLFNGKEMNYSTVTSTFRAGFVPVIYGDFYTDGIKGGIISGDDLMVAACREVKPDMAIFLSDVDGVFDEDPKKFKDATLIRKFQSHAPRFNHVSNDVTGGMDNKFRAMLQCRDMGIKTYLINGNYPERIRDIGKENFVGTEF